MWALFVVVFYLQTPDSVGKVAGSFELRMRSQESCIKSKEQMEKNWNYEKHRINASCTYKGYLQ
jgi:hypothetical protein